MSNNPLARTTGNGVAGAEWLTPASLDQGMTLANMMAKTALVPDHLKGKPEDCFPILVQALRWKMDPFAVAQCTSVVHGRLCFEGKLVHAVLISMGAIDGRLSYEYSGDGAKRSVTVTGTPRGGKPSSVSGTVGQWRTHGKDRQGNPTKNAWDSDPDMMLAYRGTRAWARLYCPDAMLGVATPDEMQEQETHEATATVVSTVMPELKPAAAREVLAVEPEQQPEQPQEPQPEVERPTLEDVTASFSKLWKASKPAGKAILERWQIAKVPEIMNSPAPQRSAFIDDCEEAEARLMEGQP
jgi:hypothetical protein